MNLKRSFLELAILGSVANAQSTGATTDDNAQTTASTSTVAPTSDETTPASGETTPTSDETTSTSGETTPTSGEATPTNSDNNAQSSSDNNTQSNSDNNTQTSDNVTETGSSSSNTIPTSAPSAIPSASESAPTAEHVWETKVLPALDCPAPSQVAYEPWVTDLAAGADGVVAALGGKDINVVASSVRDLICELNNLVSPPTVAIDPSADLASYDTTSGKIATSLSQLAENADSLTDGLSARDLFARADITLKDYADSLASGVIAYENLMSAAIEAGTSNCPERVSFSSLVDAMGVALSSLADEFDLTLTYPTAPALCAASSGALSSPSSLPSSPSGNVTSPSSLLSSAFVNVTSTPTSCPPCSGVDCPPCPAPTPSCDTCTPICTASPCVPVCPTCEVVTTVVTAFTTYCPEPTTLCTNNVCHTLTAPGTLTITDCPCTIVTAVTPPSNPTNNGNAQSPGEGAGGANSNPTGGPGIGGSPGAGVGANPTAAPSVGDSSVTAVSSHSSSSVLAANGANPLGMNLLLAFTAFFILF